VDNGLAGTTLRINLTTSEIKRIPTDEELFRRWHGGRGVIAKILYDEVPRNADPLGAENIFIINVGIISGCYIPAGSKVEFGSVSPLTNGHGDSNMGGHIGPMLKFAGATSMGSHWVFWIQSLIGLFLSSKTSVIVQGKS